MPDTPELGFDHETLMHLGGAVRAYFADLYPLRTLSLGDRIRAIIDHYGSQTATAREIGISRSTLARWSHGTTPKQPNRIRANLAYQRVHLAIHGFRPSNPFERRLAEAWSAGMTSLELGRVMEQILTQDNSVPKVLVVRGPVSFEAGMGRMWIPDCSISDDDIRGAFPFNVGNYAA